jgi:hypothetical protein
MSKRFTSYPPPQHGKVKENDYERNKRLGASFTGFRGLACIIIILKKKRNIFSHTNDIIHSPASSVTTVTRLRPGRPGFSSRRGE